MDFCPFEFSEKQYVNEMVDNAISSILNALKESRLEKNLRAIILSGALAKDEGTIFRKNNEVLVLSDMDLHFVVKHPWDFFFLPKKINTILKYLSLPFEVSIGFGWRVNACRTIQFYEMKKIGKIVYGDLGVLDSILVDAPDEIPRWEGIRLLLNRLVELASILTKYEISALAENPFRFYYVCMKAYLACCDQLLLMENEYAPTYRERFERFVRIFNSSNLRQEMPDLEEKVVEAAKFKLGINDHPTALVKNISARALWFDCRDTLLKILKYSLATYLKTRTGKLEFLLEELRKRMPAGSSGFVHYLNTILRDRKLPSSLLVLKPPRLYAQIAGVQLARALNEDLTADIELMRSAIGYLRILENSRNLKAHLDESFQTWKKLVGIVCSISSKMPDTLLKKDFR